MGSLLDSGPVVEPPDDPEDLEAPRVAIDIHPTADRDELAGQFAALLAAHTAETKKLEDRLAALEALRLSETMVNWWTRILSMPPFPEMSSARPFDKMQCARLHLVLIWG